VKAESLRYLPHLSTRSQSAWYKPQSGLLKPQARSDDRSFARVDPFLDGVHRVDRLGVHAKDEDACSFVTRNEPLKQLRSA
jgi:hypothetical protein